MIHCFGLKRMAFRGQNVATLTIWLSGWIFRKKKDLEARHSPKVSGFVTRHNLNTEKNQGVCEAGLKDVDHDMHLLCTSEGKLLHF